MSPPGSPREFFACLQCAGDLRADRPQHLDCSVCKAAYPTVGAIRVLVSNPVPFLQAHMRRLAAKWSDVNRRVEQLRMTTTGSLEALSLALGGYCGQLSNLEAISRALAPVEAYLSTHPCPDPASPQGIPIDLGGGIGWPSWEMLGYFYRDWADTSEGRFIEDLFGRAIDEHCASRTSVAILGCAASGLVQAISRYFSVTFGVDLALDSLFLASSLLEGGAIDIHLSFPSEEIPIHQMKVTVKGSEHRPGIELIAGDVTDLPFATRSLACVITSFVLDGIERPGAVIAQIQRVLVPGGLWINFGDLTENLSPRHQREFDQTNSLDLSSFCRRSGFLLQKQTMHRLALTDLSILSEWATTRTHTAVFFAATKIADAVHHYFAQWPAAQGQDIWPMIPRIVTYVALLQERVFAGAHINESNRIAVSNVHKSRLLAPQQALLLHRLLDKIDGIRSVRQIFEIVLQETPIDAPTLIGIMRALYRAEIIELKNPRMA